MNTPAPALAFHDFTDIDWSGFAGADRFPDGAEPLLADGAFADGTEFVLVLDGTGGCLVANDEQAQWGGYVLHLPFASAAAARVWAERSILATARLADFLRAGFTPAQEIV